MQQTSDYWSVNHGYHCYRQRVKGQERAMCEEGYWVSGHLQKDQKAKAAVHYSQPQKHTCLTGTRGAGSRTFNGSTNPPAHHRRSPPGMKSYPFHWKTMACAHNGSAAQFLFCWVAKATDPKAFACSFQLAKNPKHVLRVSHTLTYRSGRWSPNYLLGWSID